VTQRRPTGITIIAVLMIIGGLVLLFTGITPLFIGPLITIDSDYSTSALGFLITIGGLTFVVLGIASLIISRGLIKGKMTNYIIYCLRLDILGNTLEDSRLDILG
jgi:hypothetical protein